MSLLTERCIPCEGGALPLMKKEADALLAQVSDWALSEDAKQISKTFRFKNFIEALSFTNKVGALAEQEGHHPDIALSWGKVSITLTTHAIKGLSQNDFILAAKIDALL